MPFAPGGMGNEASHTAVSREGVKEDVGGGWGGFIGLEDGGKGGLMSDRTGGANPVGWAENSEMGTGRWRLSKDMRVGKSKQEELVRYGRVGLACGRRRDQGRRILQNSGPCGARLRRKEGSRPEPRVTEPEVGKISNPSNQRHPQPSPVPLSPFHHKH